MSAMERKRWFNPSQPQTLQIAMFLLYINAAFALLQLLLRGGLLFTVARPLFLVELARVVGAGAAWGIANERKWAYGLGVAVAAVPLAVRLLFYTSPFRDPIALMFEIALIALLLHPQSRDYQRIWFK